MNETAARDALVERGRSLYDRGYAHGSSGNLSVRLDDAILITPTGSSLGSLDPLRLAKVAADGMPLAGDPPSKEAFLHLAMYAQRPDARAIVHLHCTCAVAVSCLVHAD
ncbi:MAG: class II aldolase/adducin family protein, partial [Casimicrobiaceae bacterium]